MRRSRSQWLGWVAVVLAFAAFTAPAWAQRPAQVQKGTRMQGRVVRVQGSDRVVVRTADNREVILHTNPRTKFLLNKKAARFADLREGVEIDALFDVAGEQNLASSVVITPAAVPTAEVVEGTLVRVLEAENQLVIRTAAGKEVIVVTEPRTTFTLENRIVRLVDFRPGMPVRVNVDVRGQKHFARSVAATPRRPR